jgi:hypothetical protein
MNGTLGWLVEMWTKPALWAFLAIEAVGFIAVLNLASDPGPALFGFVGGAMTIAAASNVYDSLDERGQVAEEV